MKQSDFIKQREASWSEFVTIINQGENANKAQFTALYRQLCHDLTLAKDRYYSPTLISRLNKMLIDGQKILYQNQRLQFSSMRRWLLQDFPQALYQQRIYVLWAHLLFYGSGLLFFILTIMWPQFVYQNMSVDSLTQIEMMYNQEKPLFTEERHSSGDFEMFGYYIYNNISIAFQCFVGGILLGFGTLFFLLFNGIYFGVISAHMVNVGFSENFFSFVITHGSFELTAIVLSAAAGLIVGHKLIAPGQLSRAESLKQAGKSAYPIVLLAFLLLILAAFVEAFWSSTTMVSANVKFIVGGFCWLWMLAYVLKGCLYGAR